MPEYMLSTIDNPFNPFHQFNEWYAWDTRMGYHTLGYLARIAVVSEHLSEADQMLAIDRAIDEIVEEGLYGVHCRVTADNATPLTAHVATVA